MADTFYPTGISASPIDLTSGAAAFMKSAVESRLGEIAASREEISENAKNVMKAMSVQAAPELFRAQQDRYNKEIEDYRNSVRDIWKERGGKLTQDDRIKIQRGEEDLRNRMQSELNDLKTFQSYQEKIYDPNFRYAYNPQQYQQILGSAYNRMMKGEGLGNIAAEAAQAQIEPSIGDYTAKRYGNEIERLSQSMVGEFSGNIFTSTSSQDKEQADRLLNVIMQDPNMRSKYMAADGSFVDEERKAAVEQELRDYINQTIKQTKPYRQTTGGSTASQVTAKMKDVDYGGETYSGVSIQGTSKSYPIQKLYNTATGKWENKPNGLVGRMVFIDPHKQVGFIRSSGEAAISDENNNPYFVERSVNELSSKTVPIASKKQMAITENSSKQDIESALKPQGFEYDEFVPNEIEKLEDGSIKISGVFKKKEKVEKRRFRGEKVVEKAEERPVEKILVPLTDKDQDVVYSFNMSDRPEEFEPYLDKYTVDGKSLRSYLGAQTTTDFKGVPQGGF